MGRHVDYVKYYFPSRNMISILSVWLRLIPSAPTANLNLRGSEAVYLNILHAAAIYVIDFLFGSSRVPPSDLRSSPSISVTKG